MKLDKQWKERLRILLKVNEVEDEALELRKQQVSASSKDGLSWWGSYHIRKKNFEDMEKIIDRRRDLWWQATQLWENAVRAEYGDVKIKYTDCWQEDCPTRSYDLDSNCTLPNGDVYRGMPCYEDKKTWEAFLAGEFEPTRGHGR